MFWRSLLFAQATRPDRFGRAISSGADAVCLDLEDSVPANEKSQAREQIRNYIDLAPSGAGVALTIRINSLFGEQGLRDLLAIAEAPVAPRAVLLPKVETPYEVMLASNVLGSDVALVALVESVAGLRASDAIARVPKVRMLCFGSGDYAAEVGCSMSAAALASPRAHIAQAAAAAGIPCLDGAWLAIRDLAGLAGDCALARDLGFTGKPALHPGQVPAINDVFTPSPDAVEEAREIVAAVAAAGGRATSYRGRMLDVPVVRQAETILALARTPSSGGTT